MFHNINAVGCAIVLSIQPAFSVSFIFSYPNCEALVVINSSVFKEHLNSLLLSLRSLCRESTNDSRATKNAFWVRSDILIILLRWISSPTTWRTIHVTLETGSKVFFGSNILDLYWNVLRKKRIEREVQFLKGSKTFNDCRLLLVFPWTSFRFSLKSDTLVMHCDDLSNDTFKWRCHQFYFLPK